MRLDVKANDYFSVRPEIGAELAYRHYFGANTVKATVGVAYENELGRIAMVKIKLKYLEQMLITSILEVKRTTEQEMLRRI